jgi:hypothetical protein
MWFVFLCVGLIAGAVLAMFFEPKARYQIGHAEVRARLAEGNLAALEGKLRAKIEALGKKL